MTEPANPGTGNERDRRKEDVQKNVLSPYKQMAEVAKRMRNELEDLRKVVGGDNEPLLKRIAELEAQVSELEAIIADDEGAFDELAGDLSSSETQAVIHFYDEPSHPPRATE